MGVSGQFPSVPVLREDKTVNFDDSMSAADVQALIDEQPKLSNGATLTYQFADGAYSFDTDVTFGEFDGGKVYVRGNTGESGLHSNQAVVITLTDGANLVFNNCQWLWFDNIKIARSGVAGYSLFVVGSPFVLIIGCMVTEVTNGRCMQCSYGRVFIAECYLDGGTYGAYADQNGYVTVRGCQSSLTALTYGTVARTGLAIRDGNAPAGTTANTLELEGGEVR